MAERLAESPLRFRITLLLLLLAALGVAGRSLDKPGLYYDEAVQARPAKEFVSGVIYGTAFPGSTTTSIGGRAFPLTTQPYMGALKSQALIPSVWLFGSDPTALRLTTLLWALAGVAMIAAFARRALGESSALFAALLLFSDPSLLLLARHDWGSFALSLLLRGVALWCGWRWWETGHSSLLFAGGLALGLGLYNKVDFAVFMAAGGLGVLAAGVRPLFARLREQPRQAAFGALGFAIGFAPLLSGLASVLAARNAFSTPGESGEKLRTLLTMLDASYFQRLMEMGGLFERMQDAGQASSGPLGLALLVALAIAAGLLLKGAAADERDRNSTAFLLAAALGSLFAYSLLPGGVRIHHALNIYPFPHLLIAWVLARLARTGGATRIACGVAAIAVVALQLAVYERTLDQFEQSGGKGRWSDSIHEFAIELDSRQGAVAVSLDWGFHETLGFLTEGPRLIDAYPRIPSAIAVKGIWGIEGGAQHVYLLHETPYDLFGYGAPFLRALAELDPEVVEISRHVDREGELAFLSARVARPHQLTFHPSKGFQFRLRN